MKKLWNKNPAINESVEQFTIGKDAVFDMQLAKYDVLGSLAHIKMLHKVGILTDNELEILDYELICIFNYIKFGKFRIDPAVEDVHSQIELMLTEKLGSVGKKIHTGRSRNDQVLLDIKLFLRYEIAEMTELCAGLCKLCLVLSEKNKKALMPGYTHFQPAMPSSFGLWFGAFAEAIIDDISMFSAAFKIVNQNPLGSAAGYGTSIPIDRSMTTKLLGFDELTYNVIAAQLGRGKTELAVSCAMAAISSTLSKMAMDLCLFISPNFDFISLPDEYITGSSIMPHKKNPDVFELIRAKCNKIKSLPNEIMMISCNLPSGYHRDFQLLKENFFPAISEIKECIKMMTDILPILKIRKNILDDQRYDLIFSVEEVNKEVIKGLPFRDAYNTISKSIKDGNFHPEKKISHVHEGSINNLCSDQIRHKLENNLNQFRFKEYKTIIRKLTDKKHILKNKHKSDT
jgi:argininosuccinate lyase